MNNDNEADYMSHLHLDKHMSGACDGSQQEECGFRSFSGFSLSA